VAGVNPAWKLTRVGDEPHPCAVGIENTISGSRKFSDLQDGVEICARGQPIGKTIALFVVGIGFLDTLFHVGSKMSIGFGDIEAVAIRP